MANSDLVRQMLRAYLEQDRATADRLLADDLTFTSPQDDHIDKSAYLERCFPTAERVTSQDIRHAVDVDEETVFLLYEYELKTGGRYRNAEVIRVRNGRLAEIQVFFGGAV